LLKELLVGFPFEGELDRSIALAAMMTAVLRGGIDYAPMFLFAAHTSGDGKSYMADLISSIAIGKLCPVISASKKEEEIDKQLGALLLESPSLVSLDNLIDDIKSELLCQMCTQFTIKVRILGKSEMPDCRWRGTLLGTGNNVNFIGDMVRRGLTCHINAELEDPEKRSFLFDPIQRVLEDRGKYINAILTIARAFKLSGEKIDKPFNGFQDWNTTVRHALMWLGCEDPVKVVAAQREHDRFRLADKVIMGWMVTNLGRRSISARQLVEAAKENDRSDLGTSDALRHPELNDALAEVTNAQRGKLEVKRVGRWLSRNAGKRHFLSLGGSLDGSYCIEIAQQDGNHGSRYNISEARK
jgi:putative DNA primase/helicase